MRWLDACERALSAAVEQWPLRLFGARLEPVHLRRALERLADRERLVWSRGSIVPNHFVILLHPDDLQRFHAVAPEVERDLAAAVHVLAVRHSWHMSAPPRVMLRPDPGLRPGAVVARVEARPLDLPTDVASPLPPTAKMARSAPPGPSIQITRADGTVLSHQVLPITIGRGTTNVVVIDDPRVSRQHAEIYRDGDALKLRDLGSTNGTLVAGERIEQRRVADRLEVLLGGYPLMIRVTPP